tara:strand:+ start:281 stop:403 length:123 start_codon:yes stop_codon:yes gene_type:complete
MVLMATIPQLDNNSPEINSKSRLFTEGDIDAATQKGYRQQ